MSPTAAHRALASVTGPVGFALTNSTFTRSPAPVSLVPYSCPWATTCSAMTPWALAATLMLRNPGPATSTAAIPSTLSSRSWTCPARSRGFMPAFLASWSATLVA